MLYGFLAVAAGVIIIWIVSAIKATKDPDVIAAANLRMDVRKYKRYKQLYEEHIAYMTKHYAEPDILEKGMNDLYNKVAEIERTLNGITCPVCGKSHRVTLDQRGDVIVYAFPDKDTCDGFKELTASRFKEEIQRFMGNPFPALM